MIKFMKCFALGMLFLVPFNGGAVAQNDPTKRPVLDFCLTRFPDDQKWDAAKEDFWSSQCWSCPVKFSSRTLAPVNASNACSTGIFGRTTKALFRGFSGGPISFEYAKVPTVASGKRFTFYVGTDTQIGQEHISSFANAQHALELNAFSKRSKKTWPATFYDLNGKPVSGGGTFDEPKAIVLTGDLTEDGYDHQLTYFRWLYETEHRRFYQNNNLLKNQADHTIKYPVLVGLGNHDADHYCAVNGCAVGMFRYVNLRHKPCFYAKDCAVNAYHEPDAILEESSQSYAWDWGGVKFIQLHGWAYSTSFGKKPDGVTPFSHTNAAKWLDDYLKKLTSGTPVVLFQHFPPDKYYDAKIYPTWPQDQHVKALGDMLIDSGVKVLAIFSGHTHQASFNIWRHTHSTKPGQSIAIPSFVGGTGGQPMPNCSNCKPAGQFYVVEIDPTSRTLKAALAEWNGVPQQTGGNDVPPTSGAFVPTGRRLNRLLRW